MAIHQLVQRLLLFGAHIKSLPAVAMPEPPSQLMPLIAAVADAHRRYDLRAIDYGDRYRSGFWAIYLLSSVAVLFAGVPLALGWDSPTHTLHPFAGLWAIGEVAVIGSVILIYWHGQRRDWQAEWLRARTTAELVWYLPMLAPLLDLETPSDDANWYMRVFDPGQHLRGVDEVAALCASVEPVAQRMLRDAWSDPKFVIEYAYWAVGILEHQLRYHYRTANKQNALRHRVHNLTTALFVLTAVGALIHLLVHSLWLSLLTTFFPALGASLHGALAQSEAYRLATTSERLVTELQTTIDRIGAAVVSWKATKDDGQVIALKAAIESAIALILEEHQDWHVLVRPHNLPLA